MGFIARSWLNRSRNKTLSGALRNTVDAERMCSLVAGRNRGEGEPEMLQVAAPAFATLS
jgi:hypothetical protein